jgi:hypothetical protein
LASFVIVALERIGDPSAADAIRPYLERREVTAGNETKESDAVRPQNETNDFERKYAVRINAARALARLGDRSGAPILIGMLDEDQSLVRDYAQRQLEKMTGQRLGKDQEKWTRWWRTRARR